MKPTNPPDARPVAPEGVQTYRIKGSLNLSQVKEVDPAIPLRVAAVRDNRVLGSTVLEPKSRKELKAVEFQLEFRYPSLTKRPCGFHLMVTRGDVKATHALALETATRWIPANEWKESGKGHNPFVADVGSLVIEDRLYHSWLLRCRRYLIRGRVVCRRWSYDPIEQQWIFADHPVPGATVEAFDVDCWWWWCFKDLIGTATTGPDGYFEVPFVWCCRTWIPFPHPWTIDPDLLARIRELLALVEPPIGPFPPDPPPDPFQFTQYLRNVIGQGAAASAPRGEEFARPGPVEFPTTSALALKALLPPAPDLEALHVWPWWPTRDCAPDILFRVTQHCGGDVQVIYEEDFSQTLWNAPETVSVTLEANENACCLPPPPDPPCGNCLVFTWVQSSTCGVRVDQIGDDPGPPDLRGYAFTSVADGRLDRPFSGNLPVRGDFGEEAQATVDFYGVEYHKDGMAPGTWIDAGGIAGLLTSFSRSYWDWTALAFSPAIPFGPMEVDGKTVYKTIYKYQRDNPGAPGGSYLWDDWDLLFRIDTRQLPQGDGLYTFRLVGYRQAADLTLVDERVMPLCGTEDDTPPLPATVSLRIDNQTAPHAPSTLGHPCGPGTVHLCVAEPDCHIVSVVKNEGKPGQTNIAACADVDLADTDDVTIHFTATVPATSNDGHLQAYEMSLHYGQSGLRRIINPWPSPSAISGTLVGDPTPEKGPTYSEALSQGALRPHWYGGSFKVTVPGTLFPVSCAYLIRLRAWKRTTNGCSSPYYSHYNVTELTFCVTKV